MVNHGMQYLEIATSTAETSLVRLKATLIA
jgi:hypothetical protein